MAEKPVFSSRLTTIFTMVGVAVGLGNVWRFPYMMGRFGGSAFLFLYLFFTLIFAVPALMSELAAGRESGSGPFGTFSLAFGSRVGKLIGFLLLATILIASSYYAVVIAQVFYSAYFAAFHGFEGPLLDTYLDSLQNGWIQYTISLVMIGASLMVIYRGLNKGIEKVSKLFVPFFLVVILFLIYYAFSLEGVSEKFKEFLQPDFASLGPREIFASLGQAFYSLSLGGTFMLVYGSYLKKQDKIQSIAAWTAIGDAGAAILASLFIVPTVLVFGLDMTSGPTLIFSTLPHLFGQLPQGQLVGSLFLLALGTVAFLSLVGSLVVALNCLQEIPGLGKRKRIHLIFIIAIIEAALALPSAFDGELIGTLDLIFGSGMQLLGSGLAILGLAWGMGKMVTYRQIFGLSNVRWRHLFYFWVKWIVPGVLTLVLIGYIYSSIIAK